MNCNPNMIDTLFTSRNCVIHSTKLSEFVRENRKLFLTKQVYHTFKGYAYSQLHKIKTKANAKNPKRQEMIDKFGFDLKFSYHIVRLLNECEQILIEGDLDLQRNREQLKSIRRGDWSIEQIEDYFTNKEKDLEKLYNSSNAIPYEKDPETIKQLLLTALEMHYGSLDNLIKREDYGTKLLNELETLIGKYR